MWSGALHDTLRISVLLSVLLLTGCDDSPTVRIPPPLPRPTAAPTPDPCATPSIVRGNAAGVYLMVGAPTGTTWYNGTNNQGPPVLGVVVYGNQGDLVTICMPRCGCVPPVALP
jgi:hypothetical protein